MSSASTTTSTPATSAITLEALLETMRGFADPVASYMKREGFDPAIGGTIVFPESQRAVLYPDGGAPHYVKFSKVLEGRALMFVDRFSTLRLPGRKP